MAVRCNKPGCEKSWPRAPVLEVACPTCAAPVGVKCKRPSGHRVWGGQPHAKRDLLADELGHYGPCPLRQCGLAGAVKVAAGGGYKTELTEAGEQYVIPGCERPAPRLEDKDRQGRLW